MSENQENHEDGKVQLILICSLSFRKGFLYYIFRVLRSIEICLYFDACECLRNLLPLGEGFFISEESQAPLIQNRNGFESIWLPLILRNQEKSILSRRENFGHCQQCDTFFELYRCANALSLVRRINLYSLTFQKHVLKLVAKMKNDLALRNFL